MATALKKVLDSIDDLPDAIKALYTSKDGKFHLELDGDDDDKGKGGNGGDPGGISEEEVNRRIREAVRKTGREASEARAALKAFTELGISADDLKNLVAEHEEWKGNLLASKGQWETLRQQLVTKHEQALAKEKEETAKERQAREAVESRLRETILSNSIMSAVNEHDGRIKTLGPVLRQFAKVKTDENGAEYIEIVGEDGQPKLNKDGKPMSVSEYVAEMRGSDEYAGNFNGTGARGGGTPPGGSGGKTPPHGVRTRAEFGNDALKIGAFVSKYGNDAYKALPEK